MSFQPIVMIALFFFLISILAINPCFITCRDIFQKVFVCIQMIKQLLTDCASFLILFIIQQTQNKFCSSMVYVQVFFQNHVAWTCTSSYFIRHFMDSPAPICTHCWTHFPNMIISHRHGRLSRLSFLWKFFSFWNIGTACDIATGSDNSSHRSVESIWKVSVKNVT